MSSERVVDTRCRLGEGPIWHTDEERLYWVDIERGRLHRYDPVNDVHDLVLKTDTLAAVTVQRDGSLLAFMEAGRVGHVVDGALETTSTVVDDEADSRFNDVVADPAGRVFCGTMPTDARGGRLYRLDPDGSTTRLGDGFAIPNGMGFSPDREWFYLTETDEHTVHRYAYDEATGAVSDPEPFVVTPDGPGSPDGLTVDAEGSLWSGRWQGACVVCYDSAGRGAARFDLPAENVTSAAFGGPELEHLYVTTGGGDERPALGPGAGALFRVDPGVGGRPEFRSAIDLS